MKVILNELGHRTILEWLRPKCLVCRLPIPRGEEDHDPTRHKDFHYRHCCGCGRTVDQQEQTRAYKIRWDQHYLKAVRKGASQ